MIMHFGPGNAFLGWRPQAPRPEAPPPRSSPRGQAAGGQADGGEDGGMQKRRKISGKQMVAPGWAEQAVADSRVAEGAVAPHMQHELASESAQQKDWTSRGGVETGGRARGETAARPIVGVALETNPTLVWGAFSSNAFPVATTPPPAPLQQDVVLTGVPPDPHRKMPDNFHTSVLAACPAGRRGRTGEVRYRKRGG